MMQTKFETKSKRVKGLSFHKHRPWILASLHNGSIHLFDYRAQVLLEKFDDHNGPVRGIDFHQSQPMFVSGGDDHLIKVWNYKIKKCQFTLQGHLDYVRTVQFNQELPWIVSASDDQTVRIWNWQSRSAIAILAGHSHYVMCAAFHPDDTLIASCSLDQTIRIWDFYKLKEKSMQKSGSRPGELYGGTEVEVKHILEGHEKGVNWVTFHPTMKILASAADDKTIKLWRLSGNKHWEMDTLKGHTNNVSCVMFHPRMEILLSNSEDRTMKFWDLNRRVQIHQTRKDNDRYWIMEAHPTLNYFAAGYDNGMNVFKLERERHASVRVGSSVFYVKNKNLYLYDLTAQTKSVLAPITTNGKQVLLNQPTQVYYNGFNQGAHEILLNFDVEGGCFQLMAFDKDLRQARCVNERRGDNALACIFISKDRIAVLDQNREVNVGSFDGSNVKKWPILKKGIGKIDMIYPAPLGKILVAADDVLFLYDLSARKVLHELSVSDVKSVTWTPNYSHAVVITKTSIMIVNKTLQVINSQKETSKIKTGCFDELNSFVYSTSTHIKYMFLEGKTTGTFKSIDEPVYVAFFMKNTIYAVNREGEVQVFEVDNTDYLFKIALQSKNLEEVKEILSRGQLCGRSIICYLKDQGYSEIALFFEKDLKQRFNLAVASGNIQVAFDAAKELKEKDLFHQIAQTALALGNYDITEKCYQMTRSFDKLNFFYATTGSFQRLQKMHAVASSVDDPMLRFNTSVYTGNVEERVRTLVEAGQLPLAYMSARAHNLTDMIEHLEQELTESADYDQLQVFDETEKYLAKSKALLPLRPISLQDQQSYFTQWPMTNLRAKEAEKAAQMFQRQKNLQDQDDKAFFDSNEFASTTNKEVANILDVGDVEGDGDAAVDTNVNLEEAEWGGDDDLDIDADEILGSANKEGELINVDGVDEDSDIFVPPSAGIDPIKLALRDNPSNAGLNVVTGEFQKALELLKSQLAVTNYEPLKQLFVDAYTLTKMKVQTLPHGPALDLTLKARGNLPLLPVTVQSVESKVARGVEFTTKGDFKKALESFRGSLQQITLMAVTTKAEQKTIAGLIRKIVEYTTAMRIELERKRNVQSDPTNIVRIAELACYMTLCGMENAHKFLAFKNAFTFNYKNKNFITAAHFARQVVDLESTGIFATKPEIVAQYKKYFQACKQLGTNALKLKFDPEDSVQVKDIMGNGYLCAGSLTQLEDNRTNMTVKCPLDGSIFEKAAYNGKLCDTCQLCKLGEDTIGLSILLEGQEETEIPLF